MAAEELERVGAPVMTELNRRGGAGFEEGGPPILDTNLVAKEETTPEAEERVLGNDLGSVLDA